MPALSMSVMSGQAFDAAGPEKGSGMRTRMACG